MKELPTPVGVPEPIYQVIKLDLLQPSKHQPRTVDTRSTAFRDLVESIRHLGVREPLQIRALAAGSLPGDRTAGGQWEILAGHRRAAAAREAGLEVVPVLDYGAIEDGAAAEIVYVTNYAREDLTPLEEGKAAALLLAAYEGSTAAVASRMGKSEAWVRQRAAIATMEPCWEKALGDDEDGERVTAAHLALIARFPADVQRAIFKEMKEKNFWPLRRSVADLRERLADWLGALALAPFDGADATLVGRAGPCTTCPKRSDREPLLFAEETASKGKKEEAAARCLDRNCWRAKEQAHLKAMMAAAQKEHGEQLTYMVKEDWYELPYEQRQRIESSGETVLKPGEFEKAKEGEKGAKPALVIVGKKMGKVEWVRPLSKKEREHHAGQTPKQRKEEAITARAVKIIQKKLAEISWEGLPALPTEWEPVLTLLTLALGDLWDKETRNTIPAETVIAASREQKLGWLWKKMLKLLEPTRYTLDEADPDQRAMYQLLAIDVRAVLAQAKDEIEEKAAGGKAAKADQGQLVEDEEAPRKCRGCGCTEETPCHHDNGVPCSWVEEDLCSVCAEKGTAGKSTRTKEKKKRRRTPLELQAAKEGD